ncbi:MAG TPA: MFS transporter [Mycobacteriales bacterium]|nr:MFS transporter [Mycobacteriales bacterium]
MALATTRPLIIARALRGFADGFASVLLARYLVELGFSGLQVGVLVTATLLGSAALTLVAGLRLARFGARSVLLWSCALMAATGVGFGTVTWFWPLVLIGFVGTLNPSGGDVSLFLPTEQAALATLTPLRDRAHRFGVYNLAGTLAGAGGALVSAVPARLAREMGWSVPRTERISFLVYVVVAACAAAVYSRMGEHLPGPAMQTGLHRSRAIVMRLSLLFSIDSAGGGFALQSLLVLYLYLRFDLSPAVTGATLAATGVLSAFSQLASARIAARIGLVRTMVFTHLPANLCLILAGLVPNATAAIALLLVRSSLSQMDVPARQALVMRLVEPDERAAAASLTNVPRSLGSATTPALAGALFDWSHIGWPLVIGGAMKVIYDLLLLAQPLDRD